MSYNIIVLIFVGIPGIIFLVVMWLILFRPYIWFEEERWIYDSRQNKNKEEDKFYFPKYTDITPISENVHNKDDQQYLISELKLRNGEYVVENRIVSYEEYTQYNKEK